MLVPSPGGAHLSILEHVAEPQCVGINAHLVGDHVRVGLHREHHLGLSRRAIGAAGHIVGVHHVAVDLKMGDVVLPPAASRLRESGAAPEAAVGPAVVHHGAVPRPERSVAFHPGLDGDDRGMPGITGHQLLGVAHDHFDGSSRRRTGNSR